MRRLLALGMLLGVAGSAAAQKEVIVVGPGQDGGKGGVKFVVPGGKDGIAMPAIAPGQFLPAMEGMPGAGEMSLRYLEMPEVQKELKMTAEEKSTVPLLRDEVKDADKKMLESLKGATDFSEVTKKMMERKKEVEKQIGEVLGVKHARYEEICRQLDGLSRCLRADEKVKEGIKLTEEQEKKLQEGMMANMKLDFAGGPPDPEKLQKQIEEMQSKQNDLVMGLLTDAQKAKWKELTGEPIGFKPPPLKAPSVNVKLITPPGAPPLPPPPGAPPVASPPKAP